MRILASFLAVFFALAPIAAKADLWINVDSPLIPVPGTHVPCPMARVSTTYRNGKASTRVYDCTGQQGSFSLEANVYKYTDAGKYRTCYFTYQWSGRWDVKVHSNNGCTIHWVNNNTLDVY